MSIYTKMYKNGISEMLIKTQDVNHYLENGFTLEPKKEEAPVVKKKVIGKEPSSDKKIGGE
jgi:hypothetical protein